MSKLVRPKKDPGKCVKDSNDLMDLFQAKSVKGWWMLLGETETGGIMPKVKLFEHARNVQNNSMKVLSKNYNAKIVLGNI